MNTIHHSVNVDEMVVILQGSGDTLNYSINFLEIPLYHSLICLSRDGPKGGHYVGLWKLPLIRVANCKLPKKRKN